MRRHALGLIALAALLAPSLALATEPTLSDAERAEIVALLADSRAHVEVLVARTPDAFWATKPAPERWSVAEVVEHLILSEPLLRGLATTALASEPDPGWEAAAGLTTAELAERIKDRSQKFQAPEPLKPQGGMARDEALRRFSGERAVTLDLVRTTTAPVKMHTAEGPPGKMNVAQWLVLVGAHTERHAAQIEEVLSQLAAASTPAVGAP